MITRCRRIVERRCLILGRVAEYWDGWRTSHVAGRVLLFSGGVSLLRLLCLPFR